MKITAAVRTEQPVDSDSEWTLCDNGDRIIDRSDDDVIWVDDIDALRAELNARHGQSPSGLFHTMSHGGWCVKVYDAPVYTGDDPSELASHLSIDKSDIIAPNVATKHQEALKYGIVFNGGKATLNAKKAASKLKTKARRQVSKPIGMYDITPPCSAILSHCKDTYDITIDTKYMFTATDTTIKTLRKLVRLYDDLKGKNSHRELPQFKTLIAEWAERHAANKAKHKDNQEFCDWMDSEMKDMVSSPETTA